MIKPKIEKYKNILISKENYEKLKELGNTGDSFNFVVTMLLEQNQKLQSGNRVGARNQIATRE
jgi:predicted CopG family antitoxin